MKIGERRSAIFKQRYLPTIKAFPRTPDLLARLDATGYKLAVATSSGKSQLAALLRIANAEPYIDAKTSADDAESSKPDPDIIEVALRKTGCPSDRVLMLGDTPYDIEAAAKASIKTVALRSGGWDDAELKGALAIYDDPADLLENFDRSPFAPAHERGRSSAALRHGLGRARRDLPVGDGRRQTGIVPRHAAQSNLPDEVVRPLLNRQPDDLTTVRRPGDHEWGRGGGGRDKLQAPCAGEARRRVDACG